VEKPAQPDHPIHDLLRRRWSPRAFDSRPVEPALLRSLLEAARWAPSSSNEQPWHFLVATKERPEEFQRLLGCLMEGNVRWVRHAPVLLITVTRLRFEEDQSPNRHAFHDIGLAVANLTVEAMARGVFVHQMAGLFPDKVKELYGLPEGFEAVTAVALGYPGDPATLPDNLRQREMAGRSRKPLSSFVFEGAWGRVSPLLP
jgi:nitroreductase